MGLEVIPCTIKAANRFVAAHHRHHRPAHHALFALAVRQGDGDVCGVAIVGPPTARLADDGWTAEVRRVCVDENAPKGACSKLLSHAWRAARALGWRRLITYTLPEEGGASLRGAGWKLVNTAAGGGKHSREGRPRVDDHPTQPKFRWEAPGGAA